MEFDRAAELSAAYYEGDVDSAEEGSDCFSSLCREGGSTFRDGHKGW